MQSQFHQLITLPPHKFKKRVELESFFLDKTKEALNSNKKDALEIAIQFDDFRIQSRDKYHQPFYMGFFSLLGELIKRRWLEYEEGEEFVLKSLDEF